MIRIPLSLPISALAIALAASACTESDSTDKLVGPDFALTVAIANSQNAYCTDLLAGQTTDAGDVCVSVVGSTLNVTYNTVVPWDLTEAHLFVGATQANMPQTTKGNPKIGNFPFNSGTITGANTYTFTVDLTPWLTVWGVNASMTSCTSHNLFVAAHSALRKDNGNGTFGSETGWGNGYALVDRGSWATGFQIEIGCTGETPKPEVKTETAFAFGGAAATCFIGADFDRDGTDDGINRWGWSNGPLSEGDYQFDVYAAAGRCDLKKGTLVGTISVSYQSGVATVTYRTKGTSFLGSSFEFNQTHLYVGSEPLPRDKNGEYTVAPGQYTLVNEYTKSLSEATYAIGGLSGPVYVVAHAVVGPFAN